MVNHAGCGIGGSTEELSDTAPPAFDVNVWRQAQQQQQQPHAAYADVRASHARYLTLKLDVLHQEFQAWQLLTEFTGVEVQGRAETIGWVGITDYL